MVWCTAISPRLATVFWKKARAAAGLSPSSPQKDSKTCATALADYASGVVSAGAEVDQQGTICFFARQSPRAWAWNLAVQGPNIQGDSIEKRVLAVLCLYYFQNCAVATGTLSY